MEGRVPDLSDHRQASIELIAYAIDRFRNDVVITEFVQELPEGIDGVHERVRVYEGDFVGIGARDDP